MTLDEALTRALSDYERGRHADCEAVCRAILAAVPDEPAARLLLGVAAFAQSRHAASRRHLAVAAAVKPDLADAYLNLGVLARGAGGADAVALARRAARLLGGAAGARPFTHLAAALREAGRPGEALAAHRRALALQPDAAAEWHGYGHARRAAGVPAAAAYGRAYRLDPVRGETLSDWLFASLSVCDWGAYDALCGQVLDLIDSGRGVALPLLTLAIPTTPEQQDRAARLFHRVHVRPAAPAGPAAVLPAAAAGDGRITVGYLSADFREHATAYLTAELFERHDRARVRVVAYSYGADDGGPMRRRLERAFDRFRDIRGVDAGRVAEGVAADGVDILVDLKGYTEDARLDLLARRLAPLQVAWLGYPGTLGADTVDYLIGDPVVTPPDQQAHFRERLVRLPDTYQANDRQRPGGTVAGGPALRRADCGLPDGVVVFCAFNAPFKITPAVFTVWMEILAGVSGSVLWLVAGRDAAANLRREAAGRGVDPRRLVFAPHVPRAAHLARYRLADLALDTFPYTGHTTTSDAVWMGVPVVTCRGATFASRVAAGLLGAAGLDGTAVATLADYRALAVRLGRDAAALADVRERLAAARPTAPLFDTPRFARHLEAAYRTMWDRHRAGLPPAAFAVAPEK